MFATAVLLALISEPTVNLPKLLGAPPEVWEETFGPAVIDVKYELSTGLSQLPKLSELAGLKTTELGVSPWWTVKSYAWFDKIKKMPRTEPISGVSMLDATFRNKRMLSAGTSLGYYSGFGNETGRTAFADLGLPPNAYKFNGPKVSVVGSDERTYEVEVLESRQMDGEKRRAAFFINISVQDSSNERGPVKIEVHVATDGKPSRILVTSTLDLTLAKMMAAVGFGAADYSDKLTPIPETDHFVVRILKSGWNGWKLSAGRSFLKAVRDKA